MHTVTKSEFKTICEHYFAKLNNLFPVGNTPTESLFFSDKLAHVLTLGSDGSFAPRFYANYVYKSGSDCIYETVWQYSNKTKEYKMVSEQKHFYWSHLLKNSEK